MASHTDTDHDNTLQDTSYVHHDRSAFTYPSSYTDYGIRQPGHHHPNASFVDPASQSYFSVPSVRIVEVDPGVQMFPSKPKLALSLSVLFTFICCFACSIPAIVLSKQAVDYQKEGEKRLAARLSNQIAFWLILSVVAGIICWTVMAIFQYAYRFY